MEVSEKWASNVRFEFRRLLFELPELARMRGLELGRAEFLLWAASGGAAVRYSVRGRDDVVALGVFRWGLHAG